jgi:succinoglycan biosynthesis transport protein ExoP
MTESMDLQDLPNEEMEVASPKKKKPFLIGPLVRALIRKSWLIILSGVSVTVLAKVLIQPPPPTYSGFFQMLVEPASSDAKISAPAALIRSGGGLPNEQLFTLDYPTQLTLLRSRSLLESVAEQVRTKYPDFTYIDLSNGLSVSQVKPGKSRSDVTKIIEVYFTGEDPKTVHFILDTLANKYLRYSLDEKKTSIGQGITFINQQLPSLQKRVDSLNASIQRIQKTYGIIEPSTAATELLNQINTLQQQYTESDIQLREKKLLYTSLNNQLGLSQQEALIALTLTEQMADKSSSYSLTWQQLQDLEKKIAIESLRFQSQNPQLQVLLEQRQQLVSMMQQNVEKVLGSNTLRLTENPQSLGMQNSLRLSMITQMLTTQQEIKLLEFRIDEISRVKRNLEERAKIFPAIVQEYNELNSQLTIANQSLNQFLTQREKLQIEEAQTQLPWELVAKPDLYRDKDGKPIASTESSKKQVLMMGAAGLIMGLIASLLWEILRNKFKSPSDIKDLTTLDILGNINLYKLPEGGAYLTPMKAPEGMSFNPNNSNTSLRDLSPMDLPPEYEKDDFAFVLPLNNGQSGFPNHADRNIYEQEFLDQIDLLYTNLRFLFTSKPLGSLAISSALLGDGKSTIALHLAQAAAFLGQRVLLVDADLHDPDLGNRLELSGNQGLADLLVSQMDPLDVIQRSPLIPNLHFLTSGQVTPGVARLLASSRMRYVMEELQATYDLVIYDTPQLHDLLDGNFIAANTDGVLLVVGVNKTKATAVMKVLSQLEKYSISCLGVVATNIKKAPKVKKTKQAKTEKNLHHVMVKAHEQNGNGKNGSHSKNGKDSLPNVPAGKLKV